MRGRGDSVLHSRGMREEEPKMQSRSTLDRQRLCRVLEVVLDALDGVLDESDYRLVGTSAAMLVGAPLHAGDIDFLMRERCAVDRFGSALSAFVCEVPPQLISGGMQYFARYEICGISVEASTIEVATSSDCLEVSGTGPWVYFTRVPVGMRMVPVVRMELRLATELARDRPDRFEPLIAWMKEQATDADLLQRAMMAWGLPEERQQCVLAALQLG